MNLTPEELAQLRLIRTENVGPVAFKKLLTRCGSAQNALEQLPSLCRQYKRKVMTPPPSSAIEKEVANMEKLGASYLFKSSENYPELLKHVHDAPPVLTVLGQLNTLLQPQIAIVGNRNASAAGQKFTRTLAANLVAGNFAITSGLARGIDTAAHQGALDANGTTIAVMASGLGHIYPPENRGLYNTILENGGAIISENPALSTPTNQHFPRRNRIISGLSMAVVVTEASRRSGSLITARFAGEHGRDVFAMPGSPADPRAAGPNHLLKQGAYMLESAEDILEAITPTHFYPQQPTAYTREQTELFDAPPKPSAPEGLEEQAPPTSGEDKLLALLSSTPTGVDELIRQSGLEEAEAITLLSQMEINGQITRHTGGGISLA